MLVLLRKGQFVDTEVAIKSMNDLKSAPFKSSIVWNKQGEATVFCKESSLTITQAEIEKEKGIFLTYENASQECKQIVEERDGVKDLEFAVWQHPQDFVDNNFVVKSDGIFKKPSMLKFYPIVRGAKYPNHPSIKATDTTISVQPSWAENPFIVPVTDTVTALVIEYGPGDYNILSLSEKESLSQYEVGRETANGIENLGSLENFDFESYQE